VGQNKLECWLWDMVNTMVQRQQKSEHAFTAIYFTISSASHAFATDVICESREGASRHVTDRSPLRMIWAGKSKPTHHFDFISGFFFFL
jgi:hypothetical protein